MIFGKDRATGLNAEDIADAARKANEELNTDNSEIGGDFTSAFEDLFSYDASPISLASDAAPPSPLMSDGGSKRGGRARKRKAVDGYDSLVELMKLMVKDSNARLDTLSSRIGYDVDLSKARKDVYDVLGKIAGLSEDDRFDACDFLVGHSERLDLFMGLPEVARPAYVLRVLVEKRA